MRVFLTMIIWLLLSGVWAVGAHADTNSKLESIKSKIQALQAQLSGKKSERDELQKELELSDKSIDELERSIAAVQADKRGINDNIEQLKIRQAELHATKRDYQQHLMTQLSAAYKTGKQSKMKMLLSQKSPENIGRLLAYHQYLNIAREEQINALQNTIESLKGLGEDIQQQTWELAVNEEELKRKKAQLSQQKANKARLLQALNSDINSQSKKIKQLAADQKRVEKLLAEIAQRKSVRNTQNTVVSNAGFVNNKGKLGWPMQGTMAHGFNSRIAGDIRRAGIFIANKQKTPVYAIYNGTVVYADWFQNKGLMLIINHGNGYMSLYAHNQSLLNKEGDTVRAGERIAISGQSGNISSPGLYFEIRKNGKALNPTQWLKRL